MIVPLSHQLKLSIFHCGSYGSCLDQLRQLVATLAHANIERNAVSAHKATLDCYCGINIGITMAIRKDELCVHR